MSKFGRDLRLHKLIFEEDGLPDGTEVGYYVHGKVVLIMSYSYTYIFFSFYLIFLNVFYVMWAEPIIWL